MALAEAPRQTSAQVDRALHVVQGHVVIDAQSVVAGWQAQMESRAPDPAAQAFEKLPAHNQTAVLMGEKRIVKITSGPRAGNVAEYNLKTPNYSAYEQQGERAKLLRPTNTSHVFDIFEAEGYGK